MMTPRLILSRLARRGLIAGTAMVGPIAAAGFSAAAATPIAQTDVRLEIQQLVDTFRSTNGFTEWPSRSSGPMRREPTRRRRI